MPCDRELPVGGTLASRLLVADRHGPWGVAAHGSNLYWANDDGGQIVEAFLDGAESHPIVTNYELPTGVAVGP